VLAHAGYDVAESSTGHGGLDTARAGGVDLIILDLHVPDLDAWTFLLKSWEDNRMKKVPVVMFSASDDAASVDRARAWGCADFLRKPFTTDELLSTVSVALKSLG